MQAGGREVLVLGRPGVGRWQVVAVRLQRSSKSEKPFQGEGEKSMNKCEQMQIVNGIPCNIL